MIKLEGFNEFKKKLESLPNNVLRQGNAILTDSALKYVQLAKRSAPKDQGALIRGITQRKVDEATREVTCNAGYARFVEFGTKRRKRVPADLVSYESSLGYQKTGDYYDFLKAILDWVKRKGIGVTYSVATRRKNRMTRDEHIRIAEAIAFSIIRHGINPRPFFFSHRDVILPEMIKRLNDIKFE